MGSATQLTPGVLQAFFTQLDMRYQEGYHRRRQYYSLFSEETTSGTERKTYAWLGEMPNMRKWLGDKFINSIAARGYEITNIPFENTFAVDKHKISDDQGDIYGRAADLQGDAVARWPDVYATQQLFLGTSQLGYDGSAFFSTSHPVDIDDASQGTYSNLNAAKPLTQTNYAAAKAQMRSFRGESGLALQIMPTLLMVPPNLEQAGKQVVGADTIVQVVRNQANTDNVAAAAPTNVFQGDTTLVVNEYLIDDPDTDAWYLLSTDKLKPIVWQLREAPHRIPIVDPTNPLVWMQRMFAYSVEARAGTGFSLPFLAIKNKAS
jgi:phage major head subunit gpT-like protein